MRYTTEWRVQFVAWHGRRGSYVGHAVVTRGAPTGCQGSVRDRRRRRSRTFRKLAERLHAFQIDSVNGANPRPLRRPGQST